MILVRFNFRGWEREDLNEPKSVPESYSDSDAKGRPGRDGDEGDVSLKGNGKDKGNN
jgi:hypothetical protein